MRPRWWSAACRWPGIWEYAAANKLIDPKLTKEERREHLQATLLTSLVFAISIPLSVAHADGAKYFWIALWPAGIALRWWARYRWSKEHPGVPYPKPRARPATSD